MAVQTGAEAVLADKELAAAAERDTEITELKAVLAQQALQADTTEAVLDALQSQLAGATSATANAASNREIAELKASVAKQVIQADTTAKEHSDNMAELQHAHDAMLQRIECEVEQLRHALIESDLLCKSAEQQHNAALEALKSVHDAECKEVELIRTPGERTVGGATVEGTDGATPGATPEQRSAQVPPTGEEEAPSPTTAEEEAAVEKTAAPAAETEAAKQEETAAAATEEATTPTAAAEEPAASNQDNEVQELRQYLVECLDCYASRVRELEDGISSAQAQTLSARMTVDEFVDELVEVQANNQITVQGLTEETDSANEVAAKIHARAKDARKAMSRLEVKLEEADSEIARLRAREAM